MKKVVLVTMLVAGFFSVGSAFGGWSEGQIHFSLQYPYAPGFCFSGLAYSSYVQEYDHKSGVDTQNQNNLFTGLGGIGYAGERWLLDLKGGPGYLGVGRESFVSQLGFHGNFSDVILDFSGRYIVNDQTKAKYRAIGAGEIGYGFHGPNGGLGVSAMGFWFQRSGPQLMFMEYSEDLKLTNPDLYYNPPSQNGRQIVGLGGKIAGWPWPLDTRSNPPVELFIEMYWLTSLADGGWPVDGPGDYQREQKWHETRAQTLADDPRADTSGIHPDNSGMLTRVGVKFSLSRFNIKR
ncbi:MAG: hypothetical protein WCT37_02510 [Patescibacteria group bacterium]|jgi:hypothetical protein